MKYIIMPGKKDSFASTIINFKSIASSNYHNTTFHNHTDPSDSKKAFHNSDVFCCLAYLTTMNRNPNPIKPLL